MTTTQIPKAEWLARYRRRLITVCHMSELQAEQMAPDDEFTERSEFFEDDPEGAADEEMSYWDAD